MADDVTATTQKNRIEELRIERIGTGVLHACLWIEGDDGLMRPTKAGFVFNTDKLSCAEISVALENALVKGIVQ